MSNRDKLIDRQWAQQIKIWADQLHGALVEHIYHSGRALVVIDEMQKKAREILDQFA